MERPTLELEQLACTDEKSSKPTQICVAIHRIYDRISDMVNGVVLYEGPSLLDGEPIVAILTGLRSSSGNRKTGAMLQTWILRSDGDPVRAWQDGRDRSVCGECPHRHRSQGGQGTCYVNKGQAPLAVWRAYHRGRYQLATDPRELAAVGAGRAVRIGSYGDPGAVPAWVWRSLVARATSWTGYTHQWREADLADLCMASVDSAREALEARTLGYRYFRVAELARGREQSRGEALCPASEQAGHRVTCEGCPIKCSGGQGLNVVIPAHGATGAAFVAVDARGAA